MVPAGARPRVLVVDDIEANILAVEGLLESVDCEVIRASSGNDALKELLKRDFAVILLDVQMPGMDGFEVARLARGSPRAREIPIIFVTAMHETPETAFEGYESGAVDVLFKPVNPHMLVSKVKVFIDLYRSKRRLHEEIAAHELTLAELDAFNYSVSHDLRAPLRPLLGFSQILLEEHGASLDADGKHLLERIGAAAERMDRLITDLLRLSKISRARPVATSLDLAKLVREVVAEMKGGDPARAGDVEVVLPSEMKAYGDEGLVRIALENLLRNAWKFTSKSKEARIEVGTLSGREKPATYFVRDNGAGFDPASASKLFAPFQRLHSASEFDGTGIGLAIVQRIIHHHRGSIWAEAARDKGATFFFTLPGR